MSTSLEVIAAMVQKYRLDPAHMEIELRLGKMVDGVFVCGVSASTFESLERDMFQSDLKAEPGWSDIMDYNYRGCDNVPVRTRCEFDSEHMAIHTEHVVKRLWSACVLWNDDIACKVALSEEAPLDATPETCMPSFVRAKQRKRYRDVRGGGCVWSYDLARTWSAASALAAQHLQDTSPPAFEVECELVDERGDYLASRTDDAVAASVLLKAKMLIGVDPEVECDMTLVRPPHAKGGASKPPATRPRRGRKVANKA